MKATSDAPPLVWRTELGKFPSRKLDLVVHCIDLSKNRPSETAT